MTTPRVRILISLAGLALAAMGCQTSDLTDMQTISVSGPVGADLSPSDQPRPVGELRSMTSLTPANTTTTTSAPPPSTTTTTAPPPPTTSPPPTTPPATTPPPPAAVSPGAINHCESMMTSRINGSRASAGLPALADDGGIRSIARDWSAHMAGVDTLMHNPNMEGQVDAVRPWLAVGENVGTFSELESLYQAFMDSPTHRANIVSAKYHYVSVGCVQTASGVYWVTQLFWGA